MMAQIINKKIRIQEEEVQKVENVGLTWGQPIKKRELRNYTTEEIVDSFNAFLTREEEIARLDAAVNLLLKQGHQTRIRVEDQLYYEKLPTAKVDELFNFKADITMSKYDVDYNFRLTSNDFLSHKYGQFQMTEEMAVYPLTFTLVDQRTNRKYNAISLTDKRFDKVFGDMYGNRFGSYFINGIGLCYFYVTRDSSKVKLVYVKGSNHKHNCTNYGYITTMVHATVNRSVKKIGFAAFGWNLIDEDLYYEPIEDFNEKVREVKGKKEKNPSKSKVKTLDMLVGSLVY